MNQISYTPASEIAEKLGLKKARHLAPICGVDLTVPERWRAGVPPHHWPKLITYGRENGCVLTHDDFMKLPPTKEQATP